MTQGDEFLERAVVTGSTPLDTARMKYKQEDGAWGFVVVNNKLTLFDHMRGSVDEKDGSKKFHSMVEGEKQGAGGLSVVTKKGVDYIYLDISSGHMKPADLERVRRAVEEALKTAGRDESSFVVYTQNDLIQGQYHKVSEGTYDFLTQVAKKSNGNEKISKEELTECLSVSIRGALVPERQLQQAISRVYGVASSDEEYSKPSEVRCDSAQDVAEFKKLQSQFHKEFRSFIQSLGDRVRDQSIVMENLSKVTGISPHEIQKIIVDAAKGEAFKACFEASERKPQEMLNKLSELKGEEENLKRNKGEPTAPTNSP